MSKRLLLHHDDLGMCWGSNQAFDNLSGYGIIQSGSVMVPCPWFPHFCEVAHKISNLDIGVHLVLTSEWDNYRWRPLSTSKMSSGLIDDDGYFWKNRSELQKRINIEAAEIEMRAQIDRALKMGLDITHLDCHMGIGFLPELFDIYIQLGNEYKIPILLIKDLKVFLDFFKIQNKRSYDYDRLLNKLKTLGYPMFDIFFMTYTEPDLLKAKKGYIDIFNKIPDEKTTYFSLHPNMPGDIEKIDPSHFIYRVNDYKIFKDGFSTMWFKNNEFQLISFKEIRDSIRAISIL